MKAATTEQELFDLEELCTRFEEHWRANAAETLIEGYLDQVDESRRPQLIEELVAIECELLRGRGQTPILEQYHERFPTWASEVNSVFDACLSDGRDSGTRSPEMPARLGDYRIVGEIGRGGMGIVYEAVQESLGRRVAIKTLASHRLYNPEHYRRFEREVRAVASLHHTNIVKIHGTGEEDSLCYYAMQLVDGRSLSRVITENKTARPSDEASQNQPRRRSSLLWTSIDTPQRSVPEIGLQVAHALSHAHSRGVLHRDIKPANLLVDSEGTVWVTDFGLARVYETEDITRTGDVIGTLRYLPPEALKGQWDERGDVYGLGLTLYELLALRPAFDETDRFALLDQIVSGDRPPSLRTLDPAIPRDLETIVMKAMAFDPRDRYRSARALANDLQLLIDGQPIEARRASPAERLWKWSRRKPALAGLLTLVMFVAIFGVPTFATLWMNAEAARTTAEAERSDAVKARRMADAERRKSEVARLDAEARAYCSSMQLAQRFIEQSVGSEARHILEKWRCPAPDLADATRGWEWNYLSQQLDESLVTLKGHTDAVFYVAVRPDDAQIATVGGWDTRDPNTHDLGETILWNVLTGQRQHVLRDSEAHISEACYDPTGTRLATISMSDKPNGLRGSIGIWDAASGRLLRRVSIPLEYNRRYLLSTETKPILPRVQFSPDGNWLVVSSSGIQVRRADTYETVWQTPGSQAIVLADGAHLLVVSGQESSVFDLATGKLVRTLGKSKLPFDFMHTADGKYLSAMLNGGTHIRLWNLPDLSHIRDIPAPNIGWGGISPDGKLIVHGDRSGNLHFRTLDDSRPLVTRMGHTGPINHGAFSHDGNWLATASSDGTARLWKTDVASRSQVLETGVRHDGLGDIAFADDGSRVAYAASCAAKRFDRTIGSLGVGEKSEPHQHIDITHFTHWPRTDCVFSRDGRLLAAPAGQPNEVNTIIGYAQTGKINIWSSDTFQLLQTLDAGSPEITSVAWNRTATMLAVATYENGLSAISVFHLVGSLGEPSTLASVRCSLSVDESRVTSMSFDESLLAASTNSGLRVWNVDDSNATHETELTHYIPHTDVAAFIDFSPSGDRLAAAYQDERRVHVHDTVTGSLLYEVDAPRAVSCVRFSPNGRRLAMVGYDSLVYFCDADKGHRLITLNGADRQVGTISFTPRVIFSPDGRRVATNDWEGRVSVWEAEPMKASVR